MTDTRLVPPAKAARLLFQLPRECRVFNKLSPATQWGWPEILANKANYLLETLAWMKTKDAQRKAPHNRPKPFVPGFMGGNIASDAEAHNTEDIRDILAKPRV